MGYQINRWFIVCTLLCCCTYNKEPQQRTDLEPIGAAKVHARATLRQVGEAVRVVLSVADAPPGTIHAVVNPKSCADIAKGPTPTPSPIAGIEVGEFNVDGHGAGKLAATVTGATMTHDSNPNSLVGRSLVVYESEPGGALSNQPLACTIVW